MATPLKSDVLAGSDVLAKFDVLAFGSHPDDVELGCGGTVASLVASGYRVGIADLTRGELGSRGTPEIREQEAAEAARILGVERRINLGMPDGNIRNSRKNRLSIIAEIRATRPDILLIPAPDCRHPDHPAGARLVAEAAFQSGLLMVETFDATGAQQQPWRPPHILHYMQSIPFEPTLVVDVSDFWATRNEAVRAFASQFHTGEQDGTEGTKTEDESGTAENLVAGAPQAAIDHGPETFISNPAFMDWYDARARTYGYRIGAAFGEPFLYRHGPIGTDDLVGMLKKEKPFR